MSEANMIIFPDVTFTPEQMAAVSQMATRLFDAEAQVAHLRAQLNAVPIDYIAFLVGFVESALGRTRQSNAVADWANSIVAAKEAERKP